MRSKKITLALIGSGLIFNQYYDLSDSFADSPQNLSARNTANSFNIEVTTHLGDQQSFRQGDVVSFLMSLDKDAYVLMIYQDASNNLYQIVPNPHSIESRYKAGLFIPIPQQSEPFQFTIQPPYGTEFLWAFASNNALPVLDGRVLSGGLKKLNQSLKNIISLIRNLHLKSKYYGEAQLKIDTSGPTS